MRMKKYFLRILILIIYLAIVIYAFIPAHDDSDISFYSCQEINCSYALIELLETYPNHYCAFYDLEDDELYSAIKEGLLFEKNYEEKYARLESVSSKGLMHHKFCVLNNSHVFTGSWNPTHRGTTYNDNYVLLISSHQVAQTYKNAYEQLKNREQTLHSKTIYL